jgi:hypothetical protein
MTKLTRLALVSALVPAFVGIAKHTSPSPVHYTG